MSNVPRGGRAIVAVKFGNKNYYSKVKTGTVKLLGLTPLDDTNVGKHQAEVRGSKAGSHSYTLLLKARSGVGGVTVKTVDFPVDQRVKKSQFRRWAKSLGKVAGMTTPWGITEYWDSQHPSLKKDGLAQRAVDALGNTINNTAAGALDAAGNAAGGALQSVENAAGGALQSVGNAAGSLTNAAGNAAGNVLNTLGDVAGQLGHSLGF